MCAQDTSAPTLGEFLERCYSQLSRDLVPRSTYNDALHDHDRIEQARTSLGTLAYLADRMVTEPEKEWNSAVIATFRRWRPAMWKWLVYLYAIQYSGSPGSEIHELAISSAFLVEYVPNGLSFSK